jgi:hypothetical protein
MLLPRMSTNRALVLFKSADFRFECGFEICKRFGLLLSSLFDVLQPRIGSSMTTGPSNEMRLQKRAKCLPRTVKPRFHGAGVGS